MPSQPQLIRPLPRNRSYEQVLNHYLVEKDIASRLKQATKEQRRNILPTMYDELFAKVPDHPRLTRRTDEASTAQANLHKRAIIQPFLSKTDHYLEFGAGDCRFASDISRFVEKVYAIDISDQRNPADEMPANLELIVYDGETLSQVPAGSIDVVFSDQLIEHFHPEDTVRHFELVRRLLRPGGQYVFRTPHALTGPHDVSRFFSDNPEGFHLKEWTCGEIQELLTGLQYKTVSFYRSVKGRRVRIPRFGVVLAEHILHQLPRRHARGIAMMLIPDVYAVATR